MNPELIAKIAQILLGDEADAFIAKIADSKIVKAFRKAKAIKNALDLERHLNKLGGQLINAVLKLPKNIILKYIDNKITKNKYEKQALQNEKKILSDFTKKLRSESRDLKKNTDKAWNDYLKDNQIHRLSSSWIKYGRFDGNKNGFGVLTIWINSDNSKNKKWYGPYTYPGVNVDIWLIMRYKQGKNGTGAGSAFWKYFLKGWFVSNLRKRAYNALSKNGLIDKDEKTERMINDMSSLNKKYWNERNTVNLTNYRKTGSQHDNPYFKKNAKQRVNLMKIKAYETYSFSNAKYQKYSQDYKNTLKMLSEAKSNLKQANNTKRMVKNTFSMIHKAKVNIAKTFAGKDVLWENYKKNAKAFTKARRAKKRG